MFSADRVRRSPVTAIAFIVAALTSAPRGVGDQGAPTVEDVLDRAGNYVRQLEEHLAVVIGDETYRQDVWSRPRPGGRGGASHVIGRTIRSEMLFMWLSQENVWLSIRNVLMVDGRPIPDSKARLGS